MPRIYVACLASYNSGILHGEWIDANQTETEIDLEIRAMLRKSPEPNVIRCDFRCAECGTEFTRNVSAPNDTSPRACPECDETEAVKCVGEPYRSAEEYAIHDNDGFDGVPIGEYESLERVSKLASMIDEHGKPFVVYAQYHSGDVQFAIDNFEEAYRGTYKSAGDYAEEFSADTGVEIPAHLATYIDWEAMERDWDMSGDINRIEDDGEFYIFDGHV